MYNISLKIGVWDYYSFKDSLGSQNNILLRKYHLTKFIFLFRSRTLMTVFNLYIQ
jgi:hypothetical protein